MLGRERPPAAGPWMNPRLRTLTDARGGCPSRRGELRGLPRLRSFPPRSGSGVRPGQPRQPLPMLLLYQARDFALAVRTARPPEVVLREARLEPLASFLCSDAARRDRFPFSTALLAPGRWGSVSGVRARPSITFAFAAIVPSADPIDSATLMSSRLPWPILAACNFMGSSPSSCGSAVVSVPFQFQARRSHCARGLGAPRRS